MTRQEHLEWCKQRALEYIDMGNSNDAWASMCSDLNKHEQTRGHSGIELGMRLMFAGHLTSLDQMRKFILGFH